MLTYRHNGQVRVQHSAEEADTETGSTAKTAIEYRLEGIRVALHYFAEARTIHAQHVRIEAARHVVSRSNETITAAAKRLGVSHKHFSQAVNEIRKVTSLT